MKKFRDHFLQDENLQEQVPVAVRPSVKPSVKPVPGKPSVRPGDPAPIQPGTTPKPKGPVDDAINILSGLGVNIKNWLFPPDTDPTLEDPPFVIPDIKVSPTVGIDPSALPPSGSAMPIPETPWKEQEIPFYTKPFWWPKGVPFDPRVPPGEQIPPNF